jgi:hypothetical protein
MRAVDNAGQGCLAIFEANHSTTKNARTYSFNAYADVAP